MYVSAVPALPVRAPGEATTFYRDVLGLEVAHVDATYAVLRGGAIELHLWATRRWVPGASPRLAGSGSCRLVVATADDLDRIHAHCQGAGAVHPDGAMTDTGHRTREFAVLDPDGNQVTLVVALDRGTGPTTREPPCHGPEQPWNRPRPGRVTAA